MALVSIYADTNYIVQYDTNGTLVDIIPKYVNNPQKLVVVEPTECVVLFYNCFSDYTSYGIDFDQHNAYQADGQIGHIKSCPTYLENDILRVDWQGCHIFDNNQYMPYSSLISALSYNSYLDKIITGMVVLCVICGNGVISRITVDLRRPKTNNLIIFLADYFARTMQVVDKCGVTIATAPLQPFFIFTQATQGLNVYPVFF